MEIGLYGIDIIYREAGPRYKAVIDLFGSLLLLLPLVFVVFAVSFDYVAASWDKLEESREAGGLPGLFLLKSVILAFCVLLGLQGPEAQPGLASDAERRHPPVGAALGDRRRHREVRAGLVREARRTRIAAAVLLEQPID